MPRRCPSSALATWKATVPTVSPSGVTATRTDIEARRAWMVAEVGTVSRNPSGV